MFLLTRFAYRNLLRNWRRTLFTVCSLALGVSLSIWTDNITKGRADDIVEAVTSTYVGHYQVSTPAFRKDELIRDFMTPEQAAGFKNDFMSPRIHFASLLSSGENSMPIQLDGIDPEGENKITHLKDRLTRGEYLSQTSDCEDREILISEEQAEKLNVDLGAKIVIVGPATDGTLGNDLFRVKGIYKTDSKSFDKKISFAHHNCVAATGMVGGPHEIVFGLPPGMDPEKLEANLKTQASAQGLQLTSWKESVPQLYSIVRFSRALHNAINFILFLMISIGIVNVMMMTVFERTREFGVMSALGTKSKQVVNLVLFETIGIALIGLVAGSIIGSAIVMYHHFYGFDLHVFLGDQHSAGDFSLAMVVYPKLSLLSILKSSLITVCFMLVAGFYPALRASKLTPIEAMRTL